MTTLNVFIKAAGGFITDAAVEELNELPGYTLVGQYNAAEHPHNGDAFVDGIIHRCPREIKYEAYSFNFATLEWEVNQSAFTDHLKKRIREYRRQKTKEATDVTRVYNGETLGITPDDESLNAVIRKTWRNKEGTVSFRFNTFTPNGDADVGYRVVPTSFIESYYDDLDDANQAYRDAEHSVLLAHSVDPFETVNAAKNHFNNTINAGEV